VEEFEDNGQLVVRAEAPGVNPEHDIEVTVTEGMLRVMVHRKKRAHQEDARHYRSEFQYGSFVRTLALPAGATDKDVKARYTDGVLEVRIPMNGRQAESKKVTVTRH
jgi:HSP20 family protein